MALTTPAEVRAAGGLDHADDYLLFRLPDEASLDQKALGAITRAGAYLTSRVSSTYYTGSATSDTALDELFKGAEEMLSLYFLLFPLKARKVLGTHFAVDSEDSSRYEELIDEEVLKQVEILIEPWVVIDQEEAGFVLASMTVTTPTDRSQVLTISDILEDLRRESLGLDPLTAGVTLV